MEAERKRERERERELLEKLYIMIEKNEFFFFD